MASLFRACIIIGLFCGCLASSSIASAQMPKMFRDLLPKSSVKPETPVSPAPRDPTQAQGELKELLNQSEEMVNQPAAPIIPSIQLRGKVIGAKSSLALLSVGENSWITVQAGQSYMLPAYPGMELQIISITAEKVEVELLPQARRLLLP